ncbi:MAG: aminopeptidase P family protein, partial [Clostridia bacterium]
FSGSNCALVITKSACVLITDGRYTTQAKEQAVGFEIVDRPRPMRELICDILDEQAAHTVGYETMNISDHEICELRSMGNALKWQPQMDFACRARAVKDADEIASIHRAVDIADAALSELIPSVKPGVSERVVAAKLEYLMTKNGSERPAFETIVASGVRGSLPHGAPTDKKIMAGEMVTIDFGACCNGYMSDITRTLWMGEIPNESRRVWECVNEVLAECTKAVKPGVATKDLDKYQRDLFEKYDMAQYVVHSLGHGVGLEIHESPTVSSRSCSVLSAGMVITIEPGIYIPGNCGVRIEDTVLVTENGVQPLTKSAHMIKINCN